MRATLRVVPGLTLAFTAACTLPELPREGPRTSFVAGGSGPADGADGADAAEVVVDGEPYVMDLELLGVYLPPGVERGAFGELFDGQAIVDLGGGITAVDVGPSTRDELSSWLHVVEEDPRFAGAVGLVLHPGAGGQAVLLGKRFVVVKRPETSDGRLRELVGAAGGAVVRRRAWDRDQYVVDAHAVDSAALAEALARLNEIERVDLDLLSRTVDEGDDPLLPRQWHHHNPGGVGGGTQAMDADVDTLRAWDLEQGDADVVIAVIERHGFDDENPDLVNRMWVNDDEQSGSVGQDDDGNLLVDDLHGWSYATDSPVFPKGDHGTAVAGLAVAERGNPYGGSGTCPGCRLILLQHTDSIADQVDALYYAITAEASVVNLSWSYVDDVHPDVAAALDAVDAAGIAIVVAMRNSPIIDESATQSLASHPKVIAVGGADRNDLRAAKSFGACLDVLGPVETKVQGATGTSTEMFGVATTDVVGSGGYNDKVDQDCVEDADLACTRCFSGNSAATPVVSGIGGLVLSAAARSSLALGPRDVERILRDTADRADSANGAYRSRDGRSWTPNPNYVPSGPYQANTSTHGYGRVNAYEAVRLVAPGPVGRAGVDVVLRDNRLDWGNTEKPSTHVFGTPGGYLGHWKSPDIKCDVEPFQHPNQIELDAQAFATLTDENPIAARRARFYVRVRNRGPVASGLVRLRAYLGFAGAGLPALPSDFWTVPNAASPVWTPLTALVGTIDSVPYSGSSVAGDQGDAAAVATFEIVLPTLDPTQPEHDHFCLLALADAADDPVDPRWQADNVLVPDRISPYDNNVTQRNLRITEAPSTPGQPTPLVFKLANPFDKKLRFRLAPCFPPGHASGAFEVKFDPPWVGEELSLEAGESLGVRVLVEYPPAFEGDIDLVQEQLVAGEGARPLGGFTLRVGAP